MPMRNLFISDLDGTLLNTRSLVSAASAEIITSLSKAGALISIATARTPATVDLLLTDTFTTPPAIVMTGAAMWDRHTRRYCDVIAIPEATATHIIGCCTEGGLNPFIYNIGDDGVIDTHFYGIPSQAERHFIAGRSNLPLKRMHLMGDTPAELHGEPVLIFALGPTERIERVASQLRLAGHCSVSSYPDIFDPATAYLEVFAFGVSKAAAVRKLKERLNADRLTVFGDNLNDLPMMAVADVAVAVANAMPQVREAADIVIGANDTDSVARYMLEHAGV